MRRLLPMVAALACVAMIASGCSSDRSPSTASASESASTASPPTAPPYAVGRRTLTFVDQSRATPAHNGAPGAPDRTLPTTVWYPTAGPSGPGSTDDAPLLPGTRFALVVFGHGLGGAPDRDEELLHAVAQHGYVVAAPLFPLSNADTPGGEIADLGEQPNDVNFVIAQLTAPASPVAPEIDGSRMAVGGHSLGAMTALAVTYGRCCRNPNVDAVFSFAGVLTDFPDQPNDPPPPHVPALFEIGDHDTRIGYANGRSAYEQAPPPKWFVTVLDGQHSPPFQTNATSDPNAPAQRAVVRTTLLDFLDGTLQGDRAALARLTTDAAVPGVATVQTDLG